MQTSIDIEGLLDSLAERLAVKMRDKLAENGSSLTKSRLLTVEQAAVYLGRTKEAVEHLTGASKLPVVRSDRRVFLDVRDLDRWIETNKT
jgi:excisionase family DNA binding protein